jgi:hypothetical protein
MDEPVVNERKPGTSSLDDWLFRTSNSTMVLEFDPPEEDITENIPILQLTIQDQGGPPSDEDVEGLGFSEKPEEVQEVDEETLRQAYAVDLVTDPCAVCRNTVDVDQGTLVTDYLQLNTCKHFYHADCVPDFGSVICSNCICLICDRGGPDHLGEGVKVIFDCGCTMHPHCYSLLSRDLNLQEIKAVTLNCTRCLRCIPSELVHMQNDPLIMGPNYFEHLSQFELAKFRHGFSCEDLGENEVRGRNFARISSTNRIAELPQKPPTLYPETNPVLELSTLVSGTETSGAKPRKLTPIMKRKKWGPIIPNLVPVREQHQPNYPQPSEVDQLLDQSSVPALPKYAPPALGDRLYYSRVTLLDLVNAGFTLRDITRHLGKRRFLERFMDITVITKCLRQHWLSQKDGCSGPTFLSAWDTPMTVREALSGYKGTLKGPPSDQDLAVRIPSSQVTPMDLASLGFVALERDDLSNHSAFPAHDILEAGLTIGMIINAPYPQLWKMNFENLNVKHLPGWYLEAQKLFDLELISEYDYLAEINKLRAQGKTTISRPKMVANVMSIGLSSNPPGRGPSSGSPSRQMTMMQTPIIQLNFSVNEGEGDNLTGPVFLTDVFAFGN